MVHQLFEVAALKYPEEIALICNQHSVSYGELNKKADDLAHAILNIARHQEIIAISTSRSVEMMVSILAVLKAGKAYLPLDPSYPPERLNQIRKDSEVSFCLAAQNDREVFDQLGLQVILSDKTYDLPSQFDFHQSVNACILYTSGSTGMPKGACIGHAGISNFINWQIEKRSVALGINTLQFCHLSFDVSIYEIFVPLVTGGTLHIIDDDYRLDGGKLLEFVIQNEIHRAYFPFVTLQYLSDAAQVEQTYPVLLKEVVTAGEQLKITPAIRSFFSAIEDCTFINAYGPTEATVWVTEYVMKGSPELWPSLPPIGVPIAGAAVHILDEKMNLVASGQPGDLYISGACLANGYLHQPDLTDKSFKQWNNSGPEELRVYESGDLAQQLDNGDIEFLGRKDGQVKIRGNRVELAEIELVIAQQPGVIQVAVVLTDNYFNQKTLAAYVVGKPNGKNINLRASLTELLPDFMVPSTFIWLEQLPKTASGKVDRNALPSPSLKRPESNVLYKAPRTVLEKQITTLLLGLLQYDKIGTDDNFFELGGNSLLAQKLISELKYQYKHILPVTKLYQFPTVRGMARYLQKDSPEVSIGRIHANEDDRHLRDVAVIGMAGRFPGADTIAELWTLLKEGKETTNFFTENELDPSVPDHLRNDPAYVKARGVLKDADLFDASFFGINPKLAELMDPQQRVFLEISWEVLEKAGHLPGKFPYKVGVFAGCGTNTYYENNVLPHPKLIENVGKLQVNTVNEKDYLASRTAYHLNLTGPAVSVNSACSTSLLAVVEAVNSLRLGQCDAAIAGAASITSPVRSGHIHQEGSMLSVDGHCRPFDNDSTGTVFSDGAGVVLLKLKDDAERDGDQIFAVIKGVGFNNDGAGKGSFTAPSSSGQADAIANAITDAGIDTSTISYVEAHGTGTPIGDPIEFEGLSAAFGAQSKNQFCAIGSIKSNFGHLTQAAGVAGLIKTCLSLQYKMLPPSLGYRKPNVNINFRESPFYVNDRLKEWISETKRIAGVSSFGVGGTNVHVIVEEYEGKEVQSSAGRPYELINWSAASAKSLESYGSALEKELVVNKPNEKWLADIAFTLNTQKTAFNYRNFIVSSSLKDIPAAIQHNTQAYQLEESVETVVFTFPGQGAQYINMASALYKYEDIYKDAVDQCADILKNYIEADIREIIFREDSEEARALLKQTRYTQPALFVTSYALARLWMHWGIVPSMFCGHSVGEYVAAHLSGVFSLEDGLKLIATRAAMVNSLPSGGMLSVRESDSKITDLLTGQLSIAAVNSPKLCLVAGPHEELKAFADQLETHEIAFKLLPTSHAFHSSMMDPIVEDFKKIVSQVALSAPKIPIVSTVTGKVLTEDEATDPMYWARHLRNTVRFSDAIQTILDEDSVVFLEVGPGMVNTTLIRQVAAAGGKSVKATATLNGKDEDYKSMLTALGWLWNYGLELNWNNYYEEQQRKVVDLPTYQFDRKKYWLEPVSSPLSIQTSPFMVETIDPQLPILNDIAMRKEQLMSRVKRVFEEASGIEIQQADSDRNFYELGLDSLLMTQVAISLKKEFGLPVTFRKLNENYPSIEALTSYIYTNLPEETFQFANALQTGGPTLFSTTATDQSALGSIAQQLELLTRQVQLLSGGQPKPVVEETIKEELIIQKPFGATPKIERQSVELGQHQLDFIQKLTARYNKKTFKSKKYAQDSRSYMADPRVVSGFKPLTKELVYPIVINKSSGSKLWDLDGNEYIDVLNGFGSNMLGYQPEVIKQAMHEQIEKGYEVGPQHELAAEVSKLICEFTGFERAALCSTGSEAVLGCIRIARTVTARSLIVAFSGSYHGIIDEVLVRGTKKLKSYPAAAGIMPEAVQNILVLDYGTPESLEIIRQRASEIAAVLVEPIQSRRPDFVPVDFVREVRSITESSGSILIFDEVITGFRMHPGGAQALFNIKADLASYGKVIGGGVPIGAIAGRKELMDALDGGNWQYGDQSFPEVGVTYFAGTFVRHPLALASAKASLMYMKQRGPSLQAGLNEKGQYLSKVLNKELKARNTPCSLTSYGSLWRVKFEEDVHYADLLFTLMREKGVHILDGFPCFITEATSDEDLQQIITCFLESIDELTTAGFLKGQLAEMPDSPIVVHTGQPPLKGARLGKDQAGNPAWFIEDPDQAGKFFQLN